MAGTATGPPPPPTTAPPPPSVATGTRRPPAHPTAPRTPRTVTTTPPSPARRTAPLWPLEAGPPTVAEARRRCCGMPPSVPEYGGVGAAEVAPNADLDGVGDEAALIGEAAAAFVRQIEQEV